MSQRETTLQEGLTLAKLIKIDSASPSGIAWRVRSGKGKANKREGEPAGALNKPGGVFRVMVNGRRYRTSEVVGIIKALEASRAD